MKRLREITVAVPPDLQQNAQRATRTSVTETVRSGLTLLAAEAAYDRLRALRGKVRFSYSAEELKLER